MKQFDCILLGGQSRLIQCSEIILERGHRIAALISNDPAVNQFASSHALPAYPSFDEWRQAEPGASYEFLFSIDNPHILSREALAQGASLSINFHDGPLPDYAGVNATAWAIINGESTHGVTWHLMDAKVDAGDILKQVIFPVDDSDTVLTLNAKCFERSVELFRELVKDIETGDLQPSPQDVHRRRYFSKSHRPPALGTLDWNKTAVDIHRLVRGLNYGGYPNPLALPKLYLGDRLVICRRCEIASNHLRYPVGLVIAFCADWLTVGTATKPVKVGDFLSIEGARLALPDLLRESGLGVGDILPNLDPVLVSHIERCGELASTWEPYWAGRLDELQPLMLQQLSLRPGRDSGGTVHVSARRIPVGYSSVFPHSSDPSEQVVAGLAVFLCRVTGNKTGDVALATRQAIGVPSQTRLYFTEAIPFRIELDPAKSLPLHYQTLSDSLQSVHAKGQYAVDLPLRHQKEIKLEKERRSLSIRIEYGVEPVGQLSTSGVDLSINISKDCRKLTWFWRADAVDDTVVERLLDGFFAFLTAVVDAPDTPVSQLPLLDEATRSTMLIDWNRSPFEGQTRRLFHHTFEQHVRSDPERLAAVLANSPNSAESPQLTYGELNSWANQVARCLNGLNVTAETVVGVCLERSLYSVTAILAVLKAGGAFVVLEPRLPARRCKTMAEDAGVSIVVTLEQWAGAWAALNKPVIRLDSDADCIAQYSVENPGHPIEPGHLAYVVFTSGSTGRPKGILIEHKSVADLSTWLGCDRSITDNRRVLHSVPLGFDAAYGEIFDALSVGGGLVVLPEQCEQDAAATARAIQTYEVTSFSIVPSMLAQLLEEPALNNCPALRVIRAGGEVLSPEIRNRVLNGLNVRLRNGYGPSETTVIAAVNECNTDSTSLTVPIGRPAAYAKIYIVDEYLHPLPIGSPGELLIGGNSVSRGYLNDELLTRNKFIPNPFGPGRLYRTGDVARYLSDGRIEFLGRIDNQIKIRGQRIEVSEIELTLNEHPAIKRTVVTVFEDGMNHASLVAYVIPAESEVPPVKELKAFLLQAIPAYMVPAAIVALDHLPLTRNGKIDFYALPVPQRQHYDDVAYAAPVQGLEAAVAALWEEVLGRESIGLHDSFLDIGGDSLSAVMIINRLRDYFSVELALGEFFTDPTVSGIVKHLEQANVSV